MSKLFTADHIEALMYGEARLPSAPHGLQEVAVATQLAARYETPILRSVSLGQRAVGLTLFVSDALKTALSPEEKAKKTGATNFAPSEDEKYLYSPEVLEGLID